MLRSMKAPLTLLALLSIAGLSQAARSGFGEACNQADTHLDASTWALDSDCDATTYCAANGTCALKGCRSDVYPYGYNGVDFDKLPPLCPDGQFCPDEGEACLYQAPVNGSCQKDRDDQCQPPPNMKDLAGPLNVNGSVCLNYLCYYANVTLGQTCINENTVYSAFTDEDVAYAYIVSRDNCANDLYCDGASLQCNKAKTFGTACTGNKECISYNCDSSTQKCGQAADQPITPASWVYVLVGLGLITLIVGVMVSLWFAHRRTRKENQIKLEQYYNEQIAYRQSILSMSHAKNSLLSLPANTSPDVARRSLLSDDPQLYVPTQKSGLSTSMSFAPPNVRNDSSGGWSEDSEVLLLPDEGRNGGKNDYGSR